MMVAMTIMVAVATPGSPVSSSAVSMLPTFSHRPTPWPQDRPDTPFWLLETLQLGACQVTDLGFEPGTSAPIHWATWFCTV